MNLLESALFRLALEKRISLEEARLLSALRRTMICPIEALPAETGMDYKELMPAILSLEKRKIVSIGDGLCFLRNFEEALSSLIFKDSVPVEEKKILLGKA